MKKILITSLAIISIGLFAFKTLSDKSLAKVNKIDGVYVFVDSEPETKYTVLGEVKVTFASSGQYTDIRDKLIEKAKDKYPSGNGVIMTFRKGSADKAQVIQMED